MGDKVIKILIGLTILSLLLILGLILFSPYLLQAYKKEIAEEIGKSVHRKVEIDKISLSILSGLSMKVAGLKIHNEPGFAQPYLLKVVEIDLSLEFWPLLRQRIESREILIRHPEIFIETTAKGISNFKSLEGSKKKPDSLSDAPSVEIIPGIRISHFIVADGMISTEDRMSGDKTSLQGIGIEIDKVELLPPQPGKSLMEEIKTEGAVRIGKGKINAFEFEDLSGKYQFEKMVLKLKNWTLRGYGGKISGELNLDLNSALPRYQAAGRIEKLNLKELITGTTSAGDVLEGDFYADLKADGKGFALQEMKKQLTGNGTFNLRNGVLKTVNLARQISLLTRVREVGAFRSNEETPIEYLKGEFSISEGKMKFSTLQGKIPEGEIQGSGAVDFDRNLDFKMKLVMSQEMTAKIPENSRAYLAGSGGEGEIPFTMTGKADAPQVRLETGEIARKAAKEGVRKGVESLLNRFKP
ncbi:MAG TPA: AsmA family protein [Nitrospiria bacterium]|nr:AsmA family protein [Nitrospiria bacterium]